MDDKKVIEKVLSEVNKDEVVELALAFGNGEARWRWYGCDLQGGRHP